MDQEQRKTFDNTSSSYLSLKAELLRKRQDIQPASSASQSSSAILNNLQSTSSSLKLKNKGDLDVEVTNSSKKRKKNVEPTPPLSTPPSSSTSSREDEIAFAKSRAILEAKSKLYDEIMANNEMKLLAEDADDDDDKSFLVDFERKIYETNQNHQQMEYTDSFGRTRLVSPDEYEQLNASARKKVPVQNPSNISENEITRVERLHREQMRSKWESDMDALRNKNDVHYQDILFDEKREHGVGYYKFSTDDKQRAEQMTTLNELRTNTKSEQMKFADDKEKRQSNMADRLNKIRLRKAKEMGIDLSENHLNDNPSTTTPMDRVQIESEIKKLSNSTSNTKEEILPQASVRRTDEEPKNIKLPEVIQTPHVQVAEQKPQPTRTQPQPPPQNSMQHPSMAYPFPVMRISHLSSSTSGD